MTRTRSPDLSDLSALLADPRFDGVAIVLAVTAGSTVSVLARGSGPGQGHSGRGGHYRSVLNPPESLRRRPPHIGVGILQHGSVRSHW
jgi:hypothetical protein